MVFCFWRRQTGLSSHSAQAVLAEPQLCLDRLPLLHSGVRGQIIEHAFLSDPQSTEICQSNCGWLDALSMKLGLPSPFLVQSCQLLFPVVLCCQLLRFRQLLVLWRQGSCCLQNCSPFSCTLVTQPTHRLVIGELHNHPFNGERGGIGFLARSGPVGQSHAQTQLLVLIG